MVWSLRSTLAWPGLGCEINKIIIYVRCLWPREHKSIVQGRRMRDSALGPCCNWNSIKLTINMAVVPISENSSRKLKISAEFKCISFDADSVRSGQRKKRSVIKYSRGIIKIINLINSTLFDNTYLNGLMISRAICTTQVREWWNGGLLHALSPMNERWLKVRVSSPLWSPDDVSQLTF